MGRTQSPKPEKKPTRVKVPPSWAGCRCMCCGKIQNVRTTNFSKTKSQWFAGNDGFIPWCKECVDEMYEFYTKKYSDEDYAIKRLAMMFDTYFCDELIDAANFSRAGEPKIHTYMGRINMRQHADKSYDNVIDEERKAALANGDTSKTKVTLRMIRFWGQGQDDADQLFLEEHYKNLITRLECKTATQEILFKRIAKAELNCEKADLTGDPKKIKDANDNLQNLMGSANVKPSQTNDNTLAETNTFGTLIQKWEEHDPIPEPDPEWKDVDGIGKYFRVWVLGTLLKMFHLKNPYQEEYDEEVAKYTATKPETTVDDESDSSLREVIFGPEAGDSG